MNTRTLSIPSSCRVLPALLVLLSCLQLNAQVIDFETDGAGLPSGATIAANEYAALGVTIEDSVAPSGVSFLNDTNPANIGTPIDGNYVGVGAFGGVDTFIELLFPAGTSSLGFNWATGADATEIEVDLFDAADNPIGGTIFDPATSTFINNADFEVPAGTFSTASATAIHRVLIQDQANGTRSLSLDNLRFQQVPEPASLVLFASGALAVASMHRRR